MINGLLISIIYCIALYGVFFFGFPFENDLNWKLGLILFMPIISIGTILGSIARILYEDRFKKLLIIGLFLIYMSSLFYATFMVMSDSTPPQDGEKIISILLLGSTGFLLYGVLSLPPLLLGVFLIEKTTKPQW
jgi:uncharacterized membrane protein YfcA